jgi:predicted negative regulator of RcsB-dependent stress response
MPKLIKKRVAKKSTDTEADVKERLLGLKDTLKERQRTALQIGVGVVVIIVALIGFLVYSSASRKKASALEYEGYKVYYSNPQVQAANREELNKKALDLFKKAYDTKNSPFSLYYIAACYYELGKYDECLKTLKDFTQKYQTDEKFMPLAFQKMAITYIKKGDINEAKKTLDALYNLKGDIYKDFALVEYGRLLEKEGKTEEAKKKYDELAKKFPNSPFIDKTKANLGEKKEG